MPEYVRAVSDAQVSRPFLPVATMQVACVVNGSVVDGMAAKLLEEKFAAELANLVTESARPHQIEWFRAGLGAAAENEPGIWAEKFFGKIYPRVPRFYRIAVRRRRDV